MSRLIDADSLDSFFYSETSGTDEMIDDAVMKYPEMEIEFSDDCRALCKDIIEMCRNVIKTEPTAYDVDKVVGKLEKMEEKALRVQNYDVSFYATGQMHKAIEIVKAGGVNEIKN